MKYHAFLQTEVNLNTLYLVPKENAQDHDIFISLKALYVIVNSWKDKAKSFKNHIIKCIVLHGFDLKIAQVQEKHHTENEDQQRAIADHENHIQAIQHGKVTFQVEKDVSTRPATEISVWDTWPFCQSSCTTWKWSR